jgi:hypothetical protein
MRTGLTCFLLFAALVALAPSVAHAAAAPQPTLWSFLGIPQAYTAAREQLFNRRGNRPGLEKIPPLKDIADPAHLESDNAALKAAAEIKQAEDQKAQKIKAIKYLAKIGCGCYDKDEKVTKAIVASMEDCTEEVRLATVEAITEVAQEEACEYCSERSCCNEKISEQLAKLAYEVDETGCYVEPSERVREAAAAALAICCPNFGYLPIEEPAPPIEGAEPTPSIEGAAPEEEETDRRELDPPPPPPQEDSIVVPPADASALFIPRVLLHRTPSPEPAQLVSSRRRANWRDSQQQRVPGAGQPTRTCGAVMLVDASRNLAHVHFTNEAPPMGLGDRLRVFVSGEGQYQPVGELVIVRAFPGSAHVRPSGGLDLALVPRGSVVTNVTR